MAPHDAFSSSSNAHLNDCFRCFYYTVLVPVRTILFSKHNPFEFIIDCPQHLVVATDPLRLKQVVMNLASNSRKFVTSGYIKIGASLTPEGTVYLYVEDSGPGIPVDKRQKLFSKYQESLDSLSQGTGMGLCLSKQILDLLGGQLYLDETYRSDKSPEFPGSRFVLDLQCRPEILDDSFVVEEGHVHPADVDLERAPVVGGLSGNPSGTTAKDINNDEACLPPNLNVLIVDDDMILRRLIQRSLQRIAPAWKVHQASNGETALQMTSQAHYDLIFLDQYMASVERQLLGTETAHAMRAQGVQSVLCGLSANQIEDAFLKAGADAFVQKPFPCEKDLLAREIRRVWRAAVVRKEQDVATERLEV